MKTTDMTKREIAIVQSWHAQMKAAHKAGLHYNVLTRKWEPVPASATVKQG